MTTRDEAAIERITEVLAEMERAEQFQADPTWTRWHVMLTSVCAAFRVSGEPPPEPDEALSVAETQRLLGSDRPISIGKLPTDPLSMRMVPFLVRELTRQPTLGLYRCKICGTRWLLWPDDVHGGGWNLLDRDQRPGACCDNVAMGDQIEHLRDIPLRVSGEPAQRPVLKTVELFNSDGTRRLAAHIYDYAYWEKVKDVAFDASSPARVSGEPAQQQYRKDGWPLCPQCGEDELADLSVRDWSAGSFKADPLAELKCYRCQWTGTISAAVSEARPHPTAPAEYGWPNGKPPDMDKLVVDWLRANSKSDGHDVIWSDFPLGVVRALSEESERLRRIILDAVVGKMTPQADSRHPDDRNV